MKTRRCNLSRSCGVKMLCLFTVTLLAAAARGEVEDDVVKSFTAQPGGKLFVGLDVGSIEVSGVEAESVDVRLLRRVRTSAGRASAILTNHIVTIAQDGNTVIVRAQSTGLIRTGWVGNGPRLQVKCLVTVPRRFNVELWTAGGNISVTEVNGKVNARTSGGSLRFEKIDGTISGRTSGGSVTVAKCKGTVSVRTSGGNLQLSDIKGDIEARVSGGSIQADKLDGKSVLKTGGGSIRVTAVKGRIDARTSGGGIRLDVTEQPTGDCLLNASGGCITVALGAAVGVDIDARTSGGRVLTDLPVNGTAQTAQKKNELRGKLNGGGPLITARTSGGNISFCKK